MNIHTHHTRVQIRESPSYHVVNAKVLMASDRMEEARKVCGVYSPAAEFTADHI
jgi:hypothetical protein